MTTEEEPGPEKKRKSLLEKYEIPIQHLDYPYIKECNDVVEIERIIKILRSNEEGSYPQLLKCAEDRLEVLNPASKLLRTTEPILTKNQLAPEEWKSVEEELLNWKAEVENVESRLAEAQCVSPPSNMYPEVRRATGKFNNPVDVKSENKDSTKRINSTDYKKWDMYDADSECLKLDLEEEKRKEEKLRKELEEKKKMEEESKLSLEEKEIQLIAGTAEGLSEEERKILAMKEKELGNEFYQTNRLEQALRHYTRSICLHPTAVGYNNRAATYLKQCRFSKALDDLNIVLEKDPDNVKAHFRRALAYQHKNEFDKALDDILVVLKYEPRHVLARHVADQLRENCATMPRKHRVRVRDENNPSRLIVKEVTEEELKRDYKNKDYLEVNHLGLPKIMCNCNGKYTNDPILKSNDPIRFQHIRERYGEKSVEKIAELERSGTTSKRVKPVSVRVSDETVTSTAIVMRNKPLIEPATPSQGTGVLFGGAKRLDIVELEKIDEEEHSPNKQSLISKKIIPEKNEVLPTTCLVTDRRGTKPKKTYFGGFIEEEEEEETADLIKPFETAPDKDSAVLNEPKDEKMMAKEETGADVDERLSRCGAVAGAMTSSYGGGVMAEDISCRSAWDHVQLRFPATSFRALKNSPQSPLSNSSINDEFSSDIDSDDDEFPSEVNYTDQVVDVHQVKQSSLSEIEVISKDLFPSENLVKCECGEGYKLRPSQFETKWLGLEASANPLADRAKLIRLVCPHQLSTVIGNTLDEPLLAGFIASLNQYFDSETEKEKIMSYLHSISTLQRFKIISSFLSAKDKGVADELLKKLHPISNSIEAAFR